MSELRTNRIVPRDGLVSGASGGIIQVVQNVQGINQVNSPGDSEYDIGLNCTITPHRSDSKILIHANFCAIQEGAFPLDHYICRGNTHIHMYQTYQGTGSWTVSYPNLMFLDSPATTSAVTYKMTALCASGNDLRTNYNNTNGNDRSSSRSRGGGGCWCCWCGCCWCC